MTHILQQQDLSDEPTRAEARPAPVEISDRLVGLASACAVLLGALAAAVGPVLTFGLVGMMIAFGMFVAAAFRPIFATYVYVGTVPIVAGIDRGTVIPLLRPNEALLALLLAGALLGGYLRYLRGDRGTIHRNQVDVPLAAFVLLSTIWPLASLLLRGNQPGFNELMAVLPICKLAALFLLVRLTVRTEAQLVRCIRLIVWPGALVAMIAILQTLKFGPVLTLLQVIWSPDADRSDLVERGSTTLASPIATGDYIMISLLLVVCCRTRGLLGRREGLGLVLVLGCGVFAAGQFSAWVSALLAGAFILWQFPELRGRAIRFLPIVPLAAIVGAPALMGRLEGFGELGLPQSWLVRWDNVSNIYLPAFDPLRVLVGISPDPVLPAPETWREVIYLESGYLQFVWIGGIPLLISFVWLSVAVLRNTGQLGVRLDALGAVAATLRIAWGILLILSVIDPHLTLRGTGDLLFTLLALSTGRIDERRP